MIVTVEEVLLCHSLSTSGNQTQVLTGSVLNVKGKGVSDMFRLCIKLVVVTVLSSL